MPPRSPDELLDAYAASRRVSDPGHDSPVVDEPVVDERAVPGEFG